MASAVQLVELGAGLLTGVRAAAHAYGAVRQALAAFSSDAEPKARQQVVAPGIASRVPELRRLIQRGKTNPKIIALAKAVINRQCGDTWCIPEKAWREEAVALFGFVRGRVRYNRDTYGVESFQAPHVTLRYRGGDCDCITILLASLLQSVGYPVKLRIMQTRNAETWNHILLLAGLPPSRPTRWLSLDASMNQPAGWYPPKGTVRRVLDFDL